MAKKPITQPGLDDERELLSLEENGTSEVTLRGKTLRLHLLNGHAQRKITSVLLGKEGKEQSVSCKCVAAARLNGYFKIRLAWWAVWRWYYYIRQYSEEELVPVVAEIKKKVPLAAYLANTTLLIGMRETMMQMNREEVYRSLRELSGDSGGNSAKNANGSPNP